MAGRNSKPQTMDQILDRLIARRRADRVKWGLQQTLNKQEQAKPKAQLEQPGVAPRKANLPRILRPSAIRRICHMPAEKRNAKTEAKVMYFNSKFGKCSLTVCHEDICPYTGVCKKHKKKKPKPPTAMMKIKRSARKEPISKSKLNKSISKDATKSTAIPILQTRL